MHSHWADDAPYCECPSCIARSRTLHAVPGYQAPRPVTPDPSVPYLLLRGHWLTKLGFAIGTRVRVEAVEGRIYIDNVDAECPLETEVHYTAIEEWNGS